MNFPRAGRVKVRYYFTHKPYLPFPTVYSSHNWMRELPVDNDDDTPDPGEDWSAPRPWRNGKPPLPCDCPGPQGTPDAWMGLTDSTSPLFGCNGWGAAYDGEYDAEYDSTTYAEE